MRSILVQVSEDRAVDVVGGTEIELYTRAGFIGVMVERPAKIQLPGMCDHSGVVLGFCGHESDPNAKENAKAAVREFCRGYANESVRSLDMRRFFRPLTDEEKATIENSHREGHTPVTLFFDATRSEMTEERLRQLTGRRVTGVEIRSGDVGKITLA